MRYGNSSAIVAGLSFVLVLLSGAVTYFTYTLMKLFEDMGFVFIRKRGRTPAKRAALSNCN